MSCILHKGTVQNSGYGQVRRRGKTWLAHRWAAFCAYGEIPTGMVVRHKCDNRLCINPEHLLLGSQGDNLNDRKERHVYRKLDRAGADRVKAQLAAGSTLRAAAEQAGISVAMAHHIKTGKQWA